MWCAGANMDAHRFDALTKALSTARSRRAALRGAAALLGGLATAGIVRLPGAAAAPAPPLPPPSFDPWSVCSETQTHYCVDALVVDGVDQLAATDPQFQPSVLGTASYQVPTVASRL